MFFEPIFQQKSDAIGTLRASKDQKLLVTLLQLSSGSVFTQFVSYIRLQESTMLESQKSFCKEVIKCFGEEHLRRPSLAELMELSEYYARLGFPGCIGAVDCSGWEWKNCPVASHGQNKGKDCKPMLRVEVISDDKLMIWHVMFGSPGSKNDISIMSQSELCNDIRGGNGLL